MKKEAFIEYIKLLQKIESSQMKLMGTGVSLIDYNEDFFKAMDYLMKALFEEREIDLINDFVWTKKKIEIVDAMTSETVFVIDSPETLWEFLDDSRKERECQKKEKPQKGRGQRSKAA